MSDLRSGAIECQRCNSAVTGYEHRIKFVFHERERIKAGDYAVLSCGCEVLDYDLKISETIPSQPTEMVDSNRKDTVLYFNDAGPYTELWHPELNEREDGCE